MSCFPTGSCSHNAGVGRHANRIPTRSKYRALWIANQALLGVQYINPSVAMGDGRQSFCDALRIYQSCLSPATENSRASLVTTSPTTPRWSGSSLPRHGAHPHRRCDWSTTTQATQSDGVQMGQSDMGENMECRTSCFPFHRKTKRDSAWLRRPTSVVRTSLELNKPIESASVYLHSVVDEQPGLSELTRNLPW